MTKFKKIIAATLAATLCLTPSFTNMMNDIPVQAAASTTAGYSATMNIPDDKLSSTSKVVSYGGGGQLSLSGTGWNAKNGVYTCPANTTKNALSSGWVNTAMLRKNKFECSIQVPNNSRTNTEAKMQKLVTASVQFRTGSRPSGYSHNIPLNIVRDTANSTSSKLVYRVTSMFSNYGTQRKLTLNFGSNLKAYETVVKNAATCTGDYNCTNTEAYLIDGTGERVHLQINKKNSGITSAQYSKWLNMLVRFVNSVSDITGIQHKNIYIMFEDETSPNPNCDHFVISNDGEGVTVKMSLNYTPAVLKTIKEGTLDWGLMHELAHCYSFKSSNTKFAEAYNYNLDDVHTNVRAMTALQNCTQLRTVNISLDGTNVGNYSVAMHKAYLSNTSSDLFKMLEVFYKYTKNSSSNWVVLEKYFKGNVESAYLNNDVVYGAIETINGSDCSYTYGKYSSKPIIFETADTYRYINGLYYLCKNTTGYGSTKANFKKFLKTYVGAEVFASFIDHQTNNSDLGEAIKSDVRGDLTLNKVANSTDVTWFNGYMNNTRGLSAEGAYNADYNKDGYINSADKSAISAAIK